MKTKDWKVTVAYDNDGYPLAKEGARYLMRVPESLTADEVAFLTIRDAVARQLDLVPWKNLRYISVGVWAPAADNLDSLLACYTARERSADVPEQQAVLVCYAHPSGPSIEPLHQGDNRVYVAPDEWEKL